MKYNIISWNPIIFGDTNVAYPMIYIKPDKKMVYLINKKQYGVTLHIHDTNTIYDNKEITGIILPNSILPNYRPNFVNKTGLYSIILLTYWYEYPNINNNGFIEILTEEIEHFTDVKTVIPQNIQEKNILPEQPSVKPCIFSSLKIPNYLKNILFCIFIIILLLVCKK